MATTPARDYKQLEARARGFAAQLRPASAPEQPIICPGCFTAFAAELDPAAHKYLSAKCPDFYDTLLRFIVSEPVLDWDQRADHSVRILTHQFTACPRCSTLVDGYINIVIPRDLPPFDKVYNIACIVVAACLVPPGEEKLRTQKKPFRSGYWPSSPDRILPLGADLTVERLVHSATLYRGAVLLLTAMLQRYRPRVFEEILNPKHEFLLLRRVIHMLERAGECASAALDEYRRSRNRSSNSAATRMSDIAVVEALQPYKAYPYLLNIITYGIDCDGHDLPRFVFRYEAPVFRAIVSVLDHLSDITAWEPRLPDVAIAIYSRLDTADRLDPPAFIREAVADTVKRTEDPYVRLAIILPTVLKRRACFGPQCGKEIHQNPTGKAFSKCARCKAVQYCSKECQREDWKWKHGASHKELCDIWSEVFTIITAKEGNWNSPERVARALRAHSFPEERARRLTGWILGRDPETIPAAYAELLDNSIGSTVRPQTFDECRTAEEYLRVFEKATGTRYPPGTRLVPVPVSDSILSLGTPNKEGLIAISSDIDLEGIIQEDNGEWRSGPYMLKVVLPGRSA
ncbi:hypothetical protein EXIGLDRAFT_769335 [Exidia glandulosa HHB12029]|uniref:MYND-type domain-containing protein n=1 Tax=Exidia glandulosa HHB12029 TaxID=1314781 RepID=A0A165HJ46_EXIGL|nr:hypothetical protein EXIGLDRAFT_769335 [Exidia glandulosa HHB12029]